jgi:membrane-bound serine protease (ClpP class)
VAGLSGYEYAILFIIGVLLIAAELLLFPGTILPGIAGLCLVTVSLLKAMVDHYPSDPFLPTASQLQEPLTTLGLSLALSVAGILILIRILPQTPLYGKLVLATLNPSSASAISTPATGLSLDVGSEGISLTLLRPSGTADFGDGPVDVVTDGVFIEAGTPIRISEKQGMRTVVEAV